jgi:hypothetical protein
VRQLDGTQRLVEAPGERPRRAMDMQAEARIADMQREFEGDDGRL